MKSTLIILTLNEIEAVKSLFNEIPFEEVDECIVLDGGSTDGTIKFFSERGIPVVIQDKPGYGEAFKLGMKKAKGDILSSFA